MRRTVCRVEFPADGELVVTGRGLHGLSEPASVLDAGNSGTTLRLMMGLLAPQPFFLTFTGDASLSRRPMGRVLLPLGQMGARIYGRNDNNNLPLSIVPAGKKLCGISYDSPVASAQVKSAILLAGLYTDAPTSVTEPFVSRDHTERMLAGFGVRVEREGCTARVYPVTREEDYIAPEEITVPGDISSAAYFLVGGSIIKGSRLLLKNVGINLTRTGAGELRVKETDRLRAVADEFGKMAPGSIEELEDGLIIRGKRPICKARVHSRSDHRMAMSLAVLGAAADGAEIEEPDSVQISYPAFFEQLDRLAGA